MTQPFLGQVQPFGFNFAPLHWAFCDGQLLAISQNTALFALIGTFYGGNGTSTFALPDLRGRVPMHQGTLLGGETYDLGEVAGAEAVTLIQTEMPAHTHSFSGTSAAANWKPPVTGSAYAQSNKAGTSPGDAYYAADSQNITSLHVSSVTPFGNNLPHTNIQPYLTLNWCICIAGIFPSRN